MQRKPLLPRTCSKCRVSRGRFETATGAFGSFSAGHGYDACWSNPMQSVVRSDANDWSSRIQTGGQVERNFAPYIKCGDSGRITDAKWVTALIGQCPPLIRHVRSFWQHAVIRASIHYTDMALPFKRQRLKLNMIGTPEPITATSKIGGCQAPQSVGSALDALSQCQNVPSSTHRPVSPSARAARAAALADLRAAKTTLRRLKTRCLEHYQVSELDTLLDVSGSDCQHVPLNSTWASMRMPTSLVHAFRKQPGYGQLFEAQSSRIKERSCRLRRRLIQDGFADSNMIDDQMAYDLGL